jgi:hypothetical protein
LAATWVVLAALVPAAAQEQPPPASAEEVRLLREEIETLKTQVEALTAQLAALGPPSAAAPSAPPPAGSAPPVPEPAPAVAAPSQTSNYFNPSIAAIGNFLGVGGSNHTASLPSMSLRESEVSLQAVVDPYARADFFLSFAEEGVEVEEGFATFTTLPGGFLAKVGRMRPSFGKINTLHLHVLPWADEPLTTVNFLGGDEGWVGTGVSVARMIPLPGDIFSEVTLQAFRGEAEGLFEAPGRGDLAYNGHYRIFSDLTEAANLDFGLSYARGPNGLTESSDTRLEGVDATFRWKPLRTATYRSASVRGEYVRSRKDLLIGSETAGGWFFSGEYQLAKRWFAGARVERAERADDAALQDRGLAAILTFWPSEFSQLRGELRRRTYASGETADEALFQIQFAIGAHGAHPF